MAERDKRQDELHTTAELYNAGNAAARAGQHSKAIALYSDAIALDPQFPMAFHNRAIAYSTLGDEKACMRDLLTAVALGYDTDVFWGTFFNRIWPNVLIDLLTSNDLPAAWVERIRFRAEEHIQKYGTLFLRAYPEHGMHFSQASLPERYLLARMTAEPQEMPPALFSKIFDLCVDTNETEDAEFAWRAKFLIATVLYGRYQTSEISPSGNGFFFDHDYMMGRPHWEVAESVLQAVVGARLPARDNESLPSHLARFTLALTRDAAETLLRRRIAEPPPPGSASMNWDIAQYLFMVMIATATYLDDPDEVFRSITLARRMNASFAVSSWADGRYQQHELLAAATPPGDVVTSGHDERKPLRRYVLPGTILMEYFIYETGGDNLIRACSTPTSAHITQRYVPPDEVSALLGLGRQWQDPASLAELRGDPGIDPLALALNIGVAMTEMPEDCYEDWTDDVLFDRDILAKATGCHRLVLMPYNYLHNVPFHLLPAIRTKIDAGQIDEIVLSPSFPLSLKLAARTPVTRGTASCLFVGINSAEVDVDAEYAVVRESFQRTDALLDDSATPARLLAAVADYDVIHIACHGDFDVRKNTGYLLLADQQRVYPADLALAPGLRADLVVLNACVSGVVSREARNGDQALGLASALLYGGARQVIGTLWQVDAEAAVDFASTFYQVWRTSTRSTANIVLQTQQKMREKFADMFSWGAHIVFGDWR